MLLDLKNYFLTTLLYERQNEEEVLKNIDALNLNLKGQCFVLICAELQIKNRNVIFPQRYKEICAVLEEALACEVFISNNRIFIIVSDSEHRVLKNLNQMLVLLYEYLEKNDFKFKIYVSKSFSSINGILNAYLEIKTCAAYSLPDKNEVIIFNEFPLKELEPSFLESLKIDLEKKIKFDTSENVRKYLNSVFYNIKLQKIPLTSFFLCLFEILSVCNNIERGGVKLSFIESILINAPMDLILNKIKDKCCELNQKVSERRKNSVEKIVQQADMLLLENYKNPDYSLKALSETLHISTNYLCAIIKKTKGDSFINLLTKIRMEKAKESLLCTNLRIQEIAFEVGYTDQHYFSYCFKKFFGLTPKQMRDDKGSLKEV